MPRAYGKRAAMLVFLGIATGLLLAESALRLFGSPAPAPDEATRSHYADIYGPVFRKVSRGGDAFFETARPGMIKQSFSRRKAPNVRRVFVLGGSSGQIFPGGVLAQKLRQVLPALEPEIINCAQAGFDAYRTMLVAREIVQYDPDLVIVIVGNNEFFGLRRISRWRMRGPFSWSRLAGRMFDLWNPPVVIKSQAAADRYYEECMTRLIATIRSRGIPLLLGTLPANYRHDHFAGSGESGAASLLMFDRDFIRLLEALRRRDGRQARSCLEALSRRYPGHAALEYQAAVFARQQGRCGQAARLYERALALDPWPVVCTAERNELIRGLAARHGLPLADVARRFRELAPCGLPGFEVFQDNCHAWPSGYGIYADAIIDGLFSQVRDRRTAILAPVGEWRMAALTRTPYQQACADAVRLARRDRRLFMAQGLASIIMSSRPIDPIGLQFLRRIGEQDPAMIAGAVSRKEEWRALLSARPRIGDAAARFDEGWGKVLLHAAETLRRAGRYEEALPVFDAVIARQDGFEARCWRGWTLRALGREREARRDFAEVLRLRPALKGRL